MQNRKQRRSEISQYILHSKSFVKEKDQLKEESLSDGSVKFYIEWFASTEVQDWSWDIVKVEWINTTRFENNPVLQRQHKRGVENTIGKITKIEKVAWKGMRIKAEIILNASIEEHKSLIHWLRHWLINWFSIWFSQVKSKYDDMLNANIIEELELFEISLVDIPDNPMTVRKFFDKIISKGSEEVDPTDDDEAIDDIEDEKEWEEETDKVDVVVDTPETVVDVASDTIPDPVPETVVTEPENKPEDVVIENPESQWSDNVVVPPVIEVDLWKEAKIELKAMQLNEIAVWDMVYYRTVYHWDGWYMNIYPEMDDKPRIGYIFGIKVDWTVMTPMCEFEEATVEEPYLYILEYIEVNQTLVPTCWITVRCFDEFMIEKKYDWTMKAIHTPDTKVLENLKISNSINIWNDVKADKDEESEKNSWNAIIIKAFEDEKVESEKMLTDMIKANEVLLIKLDKSEEEKKSLQVIVDKVRKTKATVWLHYEWQKELGNWKIASIVWMMRWA